MTTPFVQAPGAGAEIGDAFSQLAGILLKAHAANQEQQRLSMEAAMQPFNIAHVQAQTGNVTSEQRARDQKAEQDAADQHAVGMLAGPPMRALAQGHRPGSPEFDDAVARSHSAAKNPQQIAAFNTWLAGIVKPFQAMAETGHLGAQQAHEQQLTANTAATAPGATSETNARNAFETTRYQLGSDYLATPEGQRLAGPAVAGTQSAVQEGANRALRRDEGGTGLAFPRMSQAQYAARRIPQLTGKLDSNGQPINPIAAAQAEYGHLRQLHVSEQRVAGPPANAAGVTAAARTTRTRLTRQGYTDAEAQQIMRQSGYNIVP